MVPPIPYDLTDPEDQSQQYIWGGHAQPLGLAVCELDMRSESIPTPTMVSIHCLSVPSHQQGGGSPPEKVNGLRILARVHISMAF